MARAKRRETAETLRKLTERNRARIEKREARSDKKIKRGSRINKKSTAAWARIHQKTAEGNQKRGAAG